MRFIVNYNVKVLPLRSTIYAPFFLQCSAAWLPRVGEYGVYFPFYAPMICALPCERVRGFPLVYEIITLNGQKINRRAGIFYRPDIENRSAKSVCFTDIGKAKLRLLERRKKYLRVKKRELILHSSKLAPGAP